jgi:hypothetical protein
LLMLSPRLPRDATLFCLRVQDFDAVSLAFLFIGRFS